MLQKTIFKTSALFVVCLSVLFFGTEVFAAQAPTANAGPDLYLTSGQSITLQGSGSDPQNSSLTYYWDCSGGTLSSYNTPQPTYTAPYAYQYNNQASYTCTLTATNGYGLTNSDTAMVFVNYNNNVGGLSVQTNSATNIYSNQATLNGYTTNPVYGTTTYAWFQWGTSASYGNETAHQTLSSAGSFNQNVANLSQNATYHFRAVAQTNYGNTVYGQDMTFYTAGSGNYYGSGSLSITKKVINLTSGNLNWQASANANPGDILSFAITMQADGQDVHNVAIRDILPANLIYKGNMTVNASLNSSGSLVSGINIGTIPAGGIEVIAYQVQVAPAANFSYGSTILNNSVSVTSTEAGTQTASAQVLVSNSAVSGATYLPTGLTNDPIRDSFFFPVALILLGSWFYFSGNIYKFSDWLEARL
jgi:hypothetical protein